MLKMKSRETLLALALILLPSSPSSADAENVSAAKREVLVESDHSWNGTTYAPYSTGAPQLTVLKLTIPAKSVLPWHTHPFPNTGYVLSGELTIHDKESGKSQTYHQGEAFAESVDRVHRGETGKEPVELIITYAGIVGKPTSIPAKGEKDEY